MQKSLLVTIFLCSCAAVYASSDTFSGLSVGGDLGLSVNLTNVESEYRYPNLFAAGQNQITHTTNETNDYNTIDFTSDLNVDYNHALNEKWFLGIGASLFLEETKHVVSDPYVINNPNQRPDRPIDYRVKTDIDPLTHFSLSVKPGYVFTEKILGYFSFSYHRMKADLTNSQLLDTRALTVSSTTFNNTSETRTFDGFGLGGGVKYKLCPNWFLNISSEWIVF